MEGCPTGLLVDITEPVKSVTPKASQRKTISRLEARKPLERSTRANSRDVLCSVENKDVCVSKETSTLDKFGSEPTECSRRNEHAMLEIENCCFLDEEKYDFDLSLSPDASSQTEETTDQQDDKEIFFGPVGYREKCIAKAVETEAAEQPDFHPLSISEMALLFKDAHIVAHHLKAKGTPMKSSSQSSQGSLGSDFNSPLLSEDFNLQGTKRKLNISDEDYEIPISKQPATDLNNVVRGFILELSTPEEKLKCVNKSEVSESKIGSPMGKSKLQRACSLRIPKSRLPGITSTGKTSLPAPGTPRTRHISMNNKILGATNTQTLNSSLCAPGQKTLPRLTVKGLVRPSLPVPSTAKNNGDGPKPTTNCLTRKPSLLRESMKSANVQRRGLAGPALKTQSCVPKGPMKATIPMNSTPVCKTTKAKTPVATPASSKSMVRRLVGSPQCNISNHQLNKSTSMNSAESERKTSAKSTTPSLTEVQTGIRRQRAIPSTVKEHSFSSSKSMSTSSTDSIIESPASNSSICSTGSNARNRRTLLSSKESSEDNRHSIPSPAARKSIPSPASRRSIASPGTRLASKLQPLKLNDNIRISKC